MHYSLFASVKDLPSPIDIWQKIIDLQIRHDTNYVEKQMAIEKFRLRSETMQQVQKRLENEIALRSNVL